MSFDDEGPRRKRVLELGCDLTAVSIEELRDYLSALNAEADRVKTMIKAKEASRDAADKVFKR